MKNIKKRFKQWLINWLLEGQFNGLEISHNTFTDSDVVFTFNIETLYLNGNKFKNVKLILNEPTINPE